jgi:hypothetical protein
VDEVDKSRPADVLAAAPGGMKAAVGIFAKEPAPGGVKTRLCPPLSAEEAAELFRTSLEETVAALRDGPFEVVLFHAGDGAYFRKAFSGLPLLPQGEGDLGRRMERALGRLLAEGHAAAALVGSDAPDLPLPLIEAAFAALRRAEAVAIPARDGGYVLIGESRHRPELFHAIPWSTPEVLAETRRRAAAHDIAYHEVGGWEDVDDLPSLLRLLERSPGSATARLARQMLARHGG